MRLVSSYLVQCFNAGVMNEPLLLSGFEQVTRSVCSDLDLSFVSRLFHLKFISYADIHIPAQSLTGHLPLRAEGPQYLVTPCPAEYPLTAHLEGHLQKRQKYSRDPFFGSVIWPFFSAAGKPHPNSPESWKKCSRIQYFSRDSHPWF